ncbi:MAG: type 1 glutamine amidotransferase domain-containing protein [Candidatus Melainabacteria bacterium HGW-Melainabacteria-1]|nr:MAG: type 1 glutamine amidotransferase domain-containing protein [Candidatus Melainabacteria bacterium HGW-Melainabacteria-1]
MPKVLIAVTSCERQANRGIFTGYDLSEVSHPYLVFRDAGYEVKFVSPKGGTPPIEKYTLSDPISRAFLEDEDAQARIRTSYQAQELNPRDYVGLFFAGGHGTLWDFPDDRSLQSLTANIYLAGGVIGAVCQGLAGLLNIRLPGGSYLVTRRYLHSLAPDAEVSAQSALPLRLKASLEAQGALFRQALPGSRQVEVSERLVTSQNSDAAERIARVMVELLQGTRCLPRAS